MSAATVISRACLSAAAAIGEGGSLVDHPGFVARFKAAQDEYGQTTRWRVILTFRAWMAIPLELRPWADVDEAAKYAEFEVDACCCSSA